MPSFVKPTSQPKKYWEFIGKGLECDGTSDGGGMYLKDASGDYHTLQSCRDACGATPTCKSFTYYKGSDWCSLWSTDCKATREHTFAISERVGTKPTTTTVATTTAATTEPETTLGTTPAPTTTQNEQQKRCSAAKTTLSGPICLQVKQGGFCNALGVGKCDHICFDCPQEGAPECTDIEPPFWYENPSCAQQDKVGNCAWRRSGHIKDKYCHRTCGLCAPSKCDRLCELADCGETASCKCDKNPYSVRCEPLTTTVATTTTTPGRCDQLCAELGCKACTCTQNPFSIGCVTTTAEP